jgi:uncharacterized membrane protein
MMVKISGSIAVALALTALIAGASGCKKEGAAQRAGKEIDRSVAKAGHQIEKAGNNLKHALKELKK